MCDTTEKITLTTVTIFGYKGFRQEDIIIYPGGKVLSESRKSFVGDDISPEQIESCIRDCGMTTISGIDMETRTYNVVQTGQNEWRTVNGAPMEAHHANS